MNKHKQPTEEIFLDEKLILLGVNAPDKETIIDILGNLLLKNGFVEKGFIKAVLDREKKFATGLPTFIPVAIPHTDPVHCKKSAISFATLDTPVEFGEMGSDGKQVSVKMVFLLSLTESSNPVEWLRKLVNYFSDNTRMQSLLKAQNKKFVANLLKSGLLLDAV